jgi:nickel-dependent lactate racemase
MRVSGVTHVHKRAGGDDMLAEIQYGSQRLELKAPQGVVLPLQRKPAIPLLPDPAAAIAAAVEQPHGFPALRRALTPDDHVAIVVDDELPDLQDLLVPLLRHILDANVRPGDITLVRAREPQEKEPKVWPQEFHEVRLIVHDAIDRKQLSYLATTRKGRRIYLNRTVVDADQAIVLAGRHFDPLLGYSGSEGAIYPALSDQATRKEMAGRLSLAVPGTKPWPTAREAAEVAWLLGAPFLIQCIPGPGATYSHIVAGTSESSEEGIRLLNECWRVEVEEPADLVVAGIEGHTFESIAAGLASASRIVKPGGRIVLLSEGTMNLGPSAKLLQESDSPALALQRIKEGVDFEPSAAFCWAGAAQRASIYMLSSLSEEQSEELFTTPLEHAGQVEKLLAAAPSCVILPSAEKTLAVTRSKHYP